MASEERKKEEERGEKGERKKEERGENEERKKEEREDASLAKDNKTGEAFSRHPDKMTVSSEELQHGGEELQHTTLAGAGGQVIAGRGERQESPMEEGGQSPMEDEEGHTPINLSPQRNESPVDLNLNGNSEVAMNLTKACDQVVTSDQGVTSDQVTSTLSTLSGLSGLSAKMRLKKQRLIEEATRNNNKNTQNGQQVPHSTAMLLAAAAAVTDQQHQQNFALHRLAEAAQKKQEEEQMEVESSSTTPTPSGSPLGHHTSGSHRSSPLGQHPPPLIRNVGQQHHQQSLNLLRVTPGLQVHVCPSPDSAIHSTYYPTSPSASPSSRHITPSTLSRNNSDASQYSNSPPNQSPIQGRHHLLHLTNSPTSQSPVQTRHHLFSGEGDHDQDRMFQQTGQQLASQVQAQAAGISRQQLINSPCPVCGDKISGFHYGIFSCESCKGFFKRTVQNKKNYVCLRGAKCPVTIATRKKCPACRFEKCLNTGMKLEAIREDRTRGGRSTYQCSYTLPAGLCPSPNATPQMSQGMFNPVNSSQFIKREMTNPAGQCNSGSNSPVKESTGGSSVRISPLLQEIMDVEHLWFSGKPPNKSDCEPVQSITVMADKRLYKLVKWCKSLPLFKNILIDDQISLLINAWCELLVFSCCFRSVDCPPGVIKVSNEKTLDLEQAKRFGIEKCIAKMIGFTQQIRRLRVDYYEYVAMKVIVLLTSDSSSLKEADQVRESQEKVVHCLQEYTTSHYPDMPSKFGELLLRMPELQRVCQVGKEMLCPRQSAEGGSSPGFNLLMELLRGDH